MGTGAYLSRTHRIPSCRLFFFPFRSEHLANTVFFLCRQPCKDETSIIVSKFRQDTLASLAKCGRPKYPNLLVKRFIGAKRGGPYEPKRPQNPHPPSRYCLLIGGYHITFLYHMSFTCLHIWCSLLLIRHVHVSGILIKLCLYQPYVRCGDGI